MNNSLEEIMQPLYDKQNEINERKEQEKNHISDIKNGEQELRDTRIEERKNLESQLEILKERKQNQIDNINERKESEINDFINEFYKTNPNATSYYISMVKNDLIKEYDKKIKSISDDYDKEINEIKEDIKKLRSRSEDEKIAREELDYLSKKDDYHWVDLREIADVKGSVRKEIIEKQNELNLELKKEKLNFDSIMLELSAFKHEYDENHRIVPSSAAAWRTLFEKSNESSYKLNQLRNELAKSEEYLKETELTEEEAKSYMRSLAPHEQEEYDSRRTVYSGFKVDENALEEEQEEVPTVMPELEVDQPELEIAPEYSDKIDINDEVIIDENEVEVEENNLSTSTKNEIAKVIYHFLEDDLKKVPSIKLEQSKGDLKENDRYYSAKPEASDKFLLTDEAVFDGTTIPGEYIYTEDVKNAVENFAAKAKGKTFTVKETGKKYKVTESGLRKFKKALKKCSALKLIAERKISEFDLMRFIGKNQTEKLVSEAAVNRNEAMPLGDYVNRNEVILAIKNSLLKPSSKVMSYLEKIGNSIASYANERQKRNEQIFGDSNATEIEEENIKTR